MRIIVIIKTIMMMMMICFRKNDRSHQIHQFHMGVRTNVGWYTSYPLHHTLKLAFTGVDNYVTPISPTMNLMREIAHNMKQLLHIHTLACYWEGIQQIVVSR